MDVAVYSHEEKEVGYNTAFADDDVTWLSVKVRGAGLVNFMIRDNKESLSFLDQLRAAVDEAIRWARKDVVETMEEKPE